MSSVFLTNLDDFIAPSQSCVVAGKAESPNLKSSGASTGKSKIALSLEDDSPDLRRTAEVAFGQGIIRSVPATSATSSSSSASSTKKATVSLDDCLACSGCITSAESILIAEQSTDRIKERLSYFNSGANEIVAVSLSPQSVASIALRLEWDQIKVYALLAHWLRSLGTSHVLNAAAGADIALIETRGEFLARYRSRESAPASAKKSIWKIPEVSTAFSSTRYQTSALDEEPMAYPVETGAPPSSALLPLLTSSCPGWVCYAEKTHPEAIPYMSSSKSPQQILGTILKRCIYRSSAVFHVSIQPCFDKKLEASRRDFFYEDSSCREVDLVLSTSELFDMLAEMATVSAPRMDVEGVPQGDTVLRIRSYLDNLARDFLVVSKEKSVDQCGAEGNRSRFISAGIRVDELFSTASEHGAALCAAFDVNGGSGGYLEHIFRYAADEIFGVNLWDSPLVYKQGRNPDSAELELVVDGKVVLRFGKAYGFRNIQSVISSLKRGKCELDFIEIMACPGGCNGGGGQLKDESGLVMATAKEASGTGIGAKPGDLRALVGRVDEEFHKYLTFRRPEDSPLVRYLYGTEQQLGATIESTPGATEAVGSNNPLHFFHTHFHAIPKLEISAPLLSANKW